MANRLPLAACQRFSSESVPKGWDVVPIRKRFWLEYGEGLVEADRAGGDYPVYGSNGIVGRHSEALVEGPGILVGRKGSVGAVHFCPGDFWPIDTVYYVRRLSNDSWKYLYYLLQYLRLDRLNAATGVPGLTRRDAHFMMGAFPSEAEQNKIVELTDVGERAIDDIESELAAARRLKTALMQQLFTKGIPGRHRKTQAIEVFRRCVEIPKDWEPARLGPNTTMIQYGTNAASNDYRVGYPVIAIPQVVASRLELGDVPYADLGNDEANELRLMENDVLLIRTNGNPDYMGKSTLVTSEVARSHVVFASYLIRVRTDEDLIRGAYLNYFLASPLGRRQALAMANTSAGNHNLGARSLKQFWIPRPDPTEQDEIVSILHQCEDTISALVAKSTALLRLKKSLFQNLLTGKVRVTTRGGA